MTATVRRPFIQVPSKADMGHHLTCLGEFLPPEASFMQSINADNYKSADWGEFPEDYHELQVAMTDYFEMFGWICCDAAVREYCEEAGKQPALLTLHELRQLWLWAYRI